VHSTEGERAGELTPLASDPPSAEGKRRKWCIIRDNERAESCVNRRAPEAIVRRFQKFNKIL